VVYSDEKRTSAGCKAIRFPAPAFCKIKLFSLKNWKCEKPKSEKMKMRKSGNVKNQKSKNQECEKLKN
jgi:hypothetical protein